MRDIQSCKMGSRILPTNTIAGRMSSVSMGYTGLILVAISKRVWVVVGNGIPS